MAQAKQKNRDRLASRILAMESLAASVRCYWLDVRRRSTAKDAKLIENFIRDLDRIAKMEAEDV